MWRIVQTGINYHMVHCHADDTEWYVRFDKDYPYLCTSCKVVLPKELETQLLLFRSPFVRYGISLAYTGPIKFVNGNWFRSDEK